MHLRLRSDGDGYEITDLVHGDTITEVLNYVQFDAQALITTFRRKVQRAKALTRAGGERLHRGLHRGAGGVYVPGGGDDAVKVG